MQLLKGEMAEIKAIDIMNYLNYTREGRDIFVMGPETSYFLKALPSDYWLPTMTTEEFVKRMKEAGYEKVFLVAVRQGSYRAQAMNMNYTEEMIYEEVKKFPDRLVGIAGYHPFFISESLRNIEKAVKEYGFKGVYIHGMGWGIAANDRKLYPCYAKCVELDIPVSMQTGQSYEPLLHEPGRPIYVDQVSLDFPEVKFICSHTGYPWCEEAVSLASTRENVFIDCSAHMPKIWPVRMKPLLDFMDTGLGRHKVLYGTNSLYPKRYLEEFMALPLKQESKVAVLRENAIRLFKL